jgi:hypothetical protein
MGRFFRFVSIRAPARGAILKGVNAGNAANSFLAIPADEGGAASVRRMVRVDSKFGAGRAGIGGRNWN